jgi:hypothetical protein
MALREKIVAVKDLVSRTIQAHLGRRAIRKSRHPRALSVLLCNVPSRSRRSNSTQNQWAVGNTGSPVALLPIQTSMHAVGMLHICKIQPSSSRGHQRQQKEAGLFAVQNVDPMEYLGSVG